MITLDGSFGEGGGALVRTALALSTLTGQPFEIKNIRSGRPQPGLKAQHLEAIMALKKICEAKTNDVVLGSKELRFTPGNIGKGSFGITIGTAGSISLLLQAVLLPCLFAPGPVTLRISGGTCGKWQASVDYFQNIVLPHFHKCVKTISLKILQRGYYPKGGGKIEIKIIPNIPRPAEKVPSFLEELPYRIPLVALQSQGILQQVRGIVNLSSNLQEKQAGERIKHAAQVALQKLNVPVSIRVEYASTLSTGGELLLWAVFTKDNDVNPHNPVLLGSDVLLDPGKSSEQVAKEAAEKLLQEITSGAAVDSYLADHLIPLMGLLPGSSLTTSKMTDHILTNMYVTEKFLPVGFVIKGTAISAERR